MDDLLSPRELAKILKVSLPTVYRWAEAGIVPSIKIEKCVRFSRDDILALLEERRRNGGNGVKRT